jgi:succinate dehydrogenase / fumarate reductase, membrane anchor subunit
MAVNYGSKRLTVGAHYGLRDWLAQRLTAVLMAIMTIVILLRVIFTHGPIDYSAWSNIFEPQWMKCLAFVTLLSLTYHAWVGIRDIWMDYVQKVSIRLTLHTLSIVWLIGCLGWGLKVLWRL